MVTISTTSGAVTVTFADNGHYLQNGSISFPLNSLVLVTDESDMAVFRNVAEDIVFSATYTELGMTKDELIELYESSFVGGSGGGLTPEEAQEMIDEAVSGKADTSALTAYATTTALNAHTSDTTVHVTASDKTNWDAKVDQSDLDDYAMTDDVNEALEVATRALYELKETKQEASAMTAYTLTSTTDSLNTVVTSHTANATIHVTGNDKTNWDGAVSALGGNKIVALTQAQFDALTTKDAHTLYIITA